MRVLFVCRANIVRSQIAEAFFRKQLGDRHEVESAGINVQKEGIALQDLNFPGLISCMDDVGLDIRRHSVTALTPEMVKNAGMVVVMAEREVCPSYLLDKAKISYWEIDGPNRIVYAACCDVRDEVNKRVSRLARDIGIAYN